MRRCVAWGLVAIVSVGLAACGGGDDDSAGGRDGSDRSSTSSTSDPSGKAGVTERSTTSTTAAPSSTAAPATTATSAPPPTPRPGGLQSELAYVRSGGFAGLTTELTIQPDGRGEVISGPASSFTLSAAELDSLVAALDQTNFAELPTNITGEPIADGYVHDVTYGGRTVHSMDTTSPSAVQPLIDVLQGIIATHSSG